jgi:hypothetical protein
MTANAGYHAYATGDVLTAAQVQYNLQNQTVMYFATTTARDAALTGAILVEGMVSYTPATGLMYYNGSAWTTVSSATSYGFTAGKNAIINGAFNVWQRGTSFTLAAGIETYTSDRFIAFLDGTISCTVSRQTFTPGTAPVAGYESAYFMRTAITSQSGGSGAFNYQKIEDVRTYAGQSVTFSFWGKADASRTVNMYLAQNFGSGGSSTVNTTATPVTLTTSWQRFTYTVTLGSLSGKTIGTNSFLTAYLSFAANTTQTIDIWGVQLEAGSTATSFQTASGTVAGELALCQRYYFRNTSGTAYGNLGGSGIGKNATTVGIEIPCPVTMRIIPTSIDYSTTRVDDYSAAIAATSLTINTTFSSLQTGVIDATLASGGTQYRPYFLEANNSTTAYVGFNAEL